VSAPWTGSSGGTEPLLRVEGLSVSFKSKRGLARAVRDLSYEVMPGESLAIVGESGSGKSVSALALLGLLPGSAVIEGSAWFEGQDLLTMPASKLRQIRGGKVSMIFQDPMTAFNPVFTIGDQIVEAIRAHDHGVNKKAALDRAVDLLHLVGVPEPKRRVHQYPHEFSGGMRQRAMIAMAIANEPVLLIADEPTTALDVTIQAQVMESLAAVQQETGAAMVLITHDLGLVAGFADRIQVMYGGRIFETASTRTIFYRTLNPYTRGLLRSIPRLDDVHGIRLRPIPGTPPSVIREEQGCSFRPRCDYATEVCRESPAPLGLVGDQHWSRCHNVHLLPPLGTETAVEA
jgi:peptide/nickel transport system ATP-binding protein